MEVARRLAHHCAKNGIGYGSKTINLGAQLLGRQFVKFGTNVAGIFGQVLAESAVEHFVEPENK